MSGVTAEPSQDGETSSNTKTRVLRIRLACRGGSDMHSILCADMPECRLFSFLRGGA